LVTYVKFVVEQPKTVNWKTIHSIDQVIMEAQRRNCLKIYFDIILIYSIAGGIPFQ